MLVAGQSFTVFFTCLVARDSATRWARRLAVQFDVGALSFGSAAEKLSHRLFCRDGANAFFRWYASCNGWRVEFTYLSRAGRSNLFSTMNALSYLLSNRAYATHDVSNKIFFPGTADSGDSAGHLARQRDG